MKDLGEPVTPVAAKHGSRDGSRDEPRGPTDTGETMIDILLEMADTLSGAPADSERVC